jgi:hypothetical protein
MHPLFKELFCDSSLHAHTPHNIEYLKRTTLNSHVDVEERGKPEYPEKNP